MRVAAFAKSSTGQSALATAGGPEVKGKERMADSLWPDKHELMADSGNTKADHEWLMAYGWRCGTGEKSETWEKHYLGESRRSPAYAGSRGFPHSG